MPSKRGMPVCRNMSFTGSLKKTSIWPMEAAMRSACGMTSQVPVHTGMPTVLFSG